MDFRESFHTIIKDDKSDFAQLVRDMCTGSMKTQLASKPELWEKLVPDYAPGCKRVIITDDYYPTLARDNVELETRQITHITETGIEVDLIVLATGFKTVEFMHPIQIYGVNGRPLQDIWKDGAVAYNGVTVEDLPNFGMFYGPNTNLGEFQEPPLSSSWDVLIGYTDELIGHNSIVLMIEAQSRYLNGMVGEVIHARQQGKTLSLKPKLAVLQSFNEKLQNALKSTSFADPNCNSWYKRDDGVITNNWSGTVVDYQVKLSQVQWQDYIVDGTGKGELGAKAPTKVGRVREESLLSDTSLLVVGVVSLLSAAGYLAARSKLLKAR
jgi:hypothetical protein